MTPFVISTAIIYLGILVIVTIWSRHGRNMRTPDQYLFGGRGFASLLSFIGISATLFSAFTLQGMPAFFYSHGAAAWIFLGVTDVCLAGMLLWGGLRLRDVARKARTGSGRVRNITDLLLANKAPAWAVYTYVLAMTIFLLPYLTIQVKGASILMQEQLPLGSTHFAWSIMIVSVLSIYGFLSGIRGVYMTDAIQGALLLGAILFVAISILQSTGLHQLFSDVEAVEPMLLGAPGPSGLLGWQFLLISFISICLMPYTQPQLATRILVARSDRTLVVTCIGLAVFSVLVILPALVIGFRGVVVAPDDPSGFLTRVLIGHIPAWIAGVFVVGIVAAAMSTADSQILAVGTEWATALGQGPIAERKYANLTTKMVAATLAIAALVLAQSDIRSLVLFSINSFIGTSLLLPLIVGACSRSRPTALPLMFVSVLALVVFVLSLAGVIPPRIANLRIELGLYGILALALAIHFGTCQTRRARQ